MPLYLDHAATTPLAPEVREAVVKALDDDFGNAGSRTHEFGSRAKQAVQAARAAVASVVAADPADVIFTSGATEANNLALLGMAAEGTRTGKRHIVTTAIEHKAVLEPLCVLQSRGFEVTYLPVGPSGRISASSVLEAVREDTLLVSVMQANNETGVLQPIDAVADGLADHHAIFHVDAAQGYGKDLVPLRHPRIDLIAVSAHKIFGPKGVGALISRRRGYARAPLEPLIYGGGQERGLRPGTAPVPLLVGFGVAAQLCLRDHDKRLQRCEELRREALEAFGALDFDINGIDEPRLAHILSVAFRGVDSEALMLSLKDLIAISNGSACTSANYEASHVLTNMALSADRVAATVRLSWGPLTPMVPWAEIAARVSSLQSEC
ncbi:putative L-cysteine desulfurase [Brevundimonas denitrificans]|uniref:Cysteine desulfurase n=1 Tax=Brevundimonas denitrificans TaxID=1443434 RepID=A0ABQ6BEI5_9CAUL|nr:aminotransferase class V-fold PLP-dependent enzyme [Brevundimonas denitrificans]GLS00435.1 putative L-cysteine desulfurase [Brevundimonas denitrificans]